MGSLPRPGDPNSNIYGSLRGAVTLHGVYLIRIHGSIEILHYDVVGPRLNRQRKSCSLVLEVGPFW